MKNKRYINARVKVIFLMAIVIVISLILETVLLSRLNSKNAKRTSTVLLDQVVTALDKNAEREKLLLDTLKGEYIEKAKAVAYVLEKKTISEDNVGELTKFARLMGIDEINIFDPQGTIYAGTNPEYFGGNFESGEQIAYFKSMLSDKGLTMCQDITPNTISNKNMMYAITWTESGDKMVQVGVEPVRLIEELKRNEISSIVNNIPYYDGIDIYVADKSTGVISGATSSDSIGKTMTEIGFPKIDLDLSSTATKVFNLNGYKTFLRVKPTAEYVVAVTYSTSANVESFIISIASVCLFLNLAGLVIFLIFNKLLYANRRSEEQYSVLTSMSGIYYSMHLIDLEKDEASEYNAQNEVKTVVNHKNGASEMMRQVLTLTTTTEYLQKALEFTDLSTIPERMRNKKIITEDVIGKRLGWFQMSFVAIEYNENGELTKVVFTTRSIDDEKKHEEGLIYKSNTDELTGFYNRRAYEDDIKAIGGVPEDDNFVYVSMDVNGLKVVNDSLGHSAGDELIIGACECMRKCFGGNGKIYRTGGDEFAALIAAGEDELEAIKRNFDATVASWTGVRIDSIAVSSGYVAKRETPDSTIREISILADKRMYEAKEKYYLSKGVDRRGQSDANTALSSLYTKIIRMNLTNDDYQILSMEIDEKTEEKGFADTISGWLTSFGLSGQVHPDDLEEYLSKMNVEYLKEYFNNNTEPFAVIYRRKIAGEYKKIMTEIIPAKDYRSDNQSLFLYVKDIDK